MTVALRPMTPRDLPLVLSGGSPFDAGPVQVETDVSPSGLDAPGRLLVVDRHDDVLGVVSWIWNQWGPTAASRCLMMGIWLAPSARDRGVGTQAQRLLVDMAFRHTDTNRVEAHTDAENIAEQRALEKVGLVREGLVRGAHWRDGKHRDGHLYSILRAEWQVTAGR